MVIFVVQYADGSLLDLLNTIVMGGNKVDYPIPLIY